jgi:hypothetical protein
LISQEYSHLQLVEVASFAVSDSFALLGAQTSPSGAVVLWAGNQSYLIVENRGVQTTVRHDSLSSPIAAALVEGDTVIEVIDADSRAVFTVTLGGRITSKQTIDEAFIIKQARHSPLGWMLLAQAPDSSLVVGRMHRGGGVQLFDNASIASLRSVHMLPWNQGLILSSITADFDTWAFDVPESAVARRFDPISLPREAVGSESAASLWVSLPLVQLDRGFLRTISDLRSDRRLLVLYDEGGRVIRQQVLNVPFGVLAAAPDSRLLVAARRADHLEVVKYRWRWADNQ